MAKQEFLTNLWQIFRGKIFFVRKNMFFKAIKEPLIFG